MMMEKLKKGALSPFFAPVFVTVGMAVILAAGRTVLKPYLEFHHWGVFPIEQISDAAWVVLFGVFYACRDVFKREKGKSDLVAAVFLSFILFMRELGAHHWLASRDSTAFKVHFFTNPNNPLHEKIVAGLIVALILAAAGLLLARYFVALVKGFFKLNNACWTIAFFGGWGIVCKAADRLPSIAHKKFGVVLSDDVVDFYSLVEEAGEMFLPLLLMLALWQMKNALTEKA